MPSPPRPLSNISQVRRAEQEDFEYFDERVEALKEEKRARSRQAVAPATKKTPTKNFQADDANADYSEWSSESVDSKEVPSKKTAGDKTETKKREVGKFETDEHVIELDTLLKKLNTNQQTGLTSEYAEELLEKNGPNALTPPKQTPLWVKFFKQMVGGFALLLWLGAILCFISYTIEYFKKGKDNVRPDNLYLGGVLAAVVVISGVFAFFQEFKSSRIMESFGKMVPELATVIRDGQARKIPARQLVVGDIVQVEAGDRVPADVRVIIATSLKVDNSMLTGESEAQSRSPACTHSNPLETKNMIFFSTYVVGGTGLGVIVQTGDDTVMGRIAGLTSKIDHKLTPLGIELSRFIKVITIVAICVGVICFCLALHLKYTWIEATLLLIGVIVAMVPEGLLPTVTVSLALTARRMANKNCLVRNLEAVETLGSVSTICSDKTGTLTQNRMSVAHLWFDYTLYSEEDQMMPDGVAYDPTTKSTYVALTKVMMLCSKAVFKNPNDAIIVAKRECIGDASETAILKFCELKNQGVMDFRQRNPKLAEIPFDSMKKYHISVHRTLESDGDKRLLIVAKGAPERIISMCSTTMVKNTEVKLDANRREAFQQSYLKLGSMGERVLGFCDLRLDANKYPPNFEFNTEEPNFPLQNMRFLGLVSLIDPPRVAVPEAVRKCRDAGIQVVMVTGDHPITAKAIAHSVYIFSETSRTIEDIAEERGCPVAKVNPLEANACVIHGETLARMSKRQLYTLLSQYKELVFARTTPEQKLQIVKGFQKMGRFVAATGDGVNDSPALRQADIGIAMGITGSDVSKEAAEMILLDDNFATIVSGIEEGRIIFDNLKKSIAYTLTSKIPELAPFLLAIFLDFPLFLGTITILCIDLGTDMFPAISMAYEGPESDIMKRTPRDPKKDRLVNSRLLCMVFLQIGVIQALSLFFSSFYVMAKNGFMPSDCLGLRTRWADKTDNAVVDSFGRSWTYDERVTLRYSVYAASFMSVVVAQWADLIICKTRRLSLFQHGFHNRTMICALFFETALAVGLQMIPYVNTALQLAPNTFDSMLTGLPFAVLIFVYDELRKMIIRRNHEGFFYRETYY